MTIQIARFHESIVGTALSCGASLAAGWGSFIATAQSVVGLVAGVAATVYSAYATYTLYKSRNLSK